MPVNKRFSAKSAQSIGMNLMRTLSLTYDPIWLYKQNRNELYFCITVLSWCGNILNIIITL